MGPHRAPGWHPSRNRRPSGPRAAPFHRIL